MAKMAKTTKMTKIQANMKKMTVVITEMITRNQTKL